MEVLIHVAGKQESRIVVFRQRLLVVTCGRCVQVNVDNIDRDLFGQPVKGGMYQPCDETWHEMRTAAHDIMLAAYEDDLVSSSNTSSCHLAP